MYFFFGYRSLSPNGLRDLPFVNLLLSINVRCGLQVITLDTAQIGLDATESDVALAGILELEGTSLNLDEVLLVFPAAAANYFTFMAMGSLSLAL